MLKKLKKPYTIPILDYMQVRKSLSEIDESLADINGLMASYIKNVLKPEPIPTQAPPVSEATKPNTYDYKPKHSVPPHDSESE